MNDNHGCTEMPNGGTLTGYFDSQLVPWAIYAVIVSKPFRGIAAPSNLRRLCLSCGRETEELTR